MTLKRRSIALHLILAFFIVVGIQKAYAQMKRPSSELKLKVPSMLKTPTANSGYFSISCPASPITGSAQLVSVSPAKDWHTKLEPNSRGRTRLALKKTEVAYKGDDVGCTEVLKCGYALPGATGIQAWYIRGAWRDEARGPCAKCTALPIARDTGNFKCTWK